MKSIKIASALLWFVPLANIAQEFSVFQVLHADSAFRQNVRIKSLDTLSPEDKIETSGLLLLVHQTGEFISVEGDTLVDIRALDALLLSGKGMVKCENKFPDLKRLLSVKSDWRIGSVSADLPEIELVVPRPFETNRAFPNQKVAIWWKALHPNKMDSFKVSFLNLDDEDVGSEVTNEPFIELEMKQFQPPHNLVVVQVSDALYPPARSEEMVFALDSTAYFMPDSFEATTAIEALEIAFYLDTINGYDASTSYYELACKLSPHLFYNTMLMNHQKRGAGR